MTSFQGLYEIRSFHPDDTNFIKSTFLRGLYYGDSWFSKIPKNIFMDTYSRAADALLAKPDIVIKIACLSDDTNTILGYSILSPDYQTVVYVYVKSAWRKKGIAKSLVPTHPSAVMHLTTLGSQLLHKLGPQCQFNPFINL